MGSQPAEGLFENLKCVSRFTMMLTKLRNPKIESRETSSKVFIGP